MMRRLALPAIFLGLLGLLLWVLFQPQASNDSGDAGSLLQDLNTGNSAASLQEQARLPELDAVSFDDAGHALQRGFGRHKLGGLVLDEEGNPVADAWVGTYTAPWPFLDFDFKITELFEKPFSFSLDPLASAVSNEEGRFDLQGVPGRTLFLTARAAMQLSPRRQRISAQELNAEDPVIVRTIAGAALSGQVLDAKGRPVGGAEILLGPGLKFLLASFRNRTFYMDRVIADGGGNFSFPAVPAGKPLILEVLAGGTEAGMAEVNPIAVGKLGKVTVHLLPLGGLSGHVVDAEEIGVSGAEVVAVPIDLRLVIPFIRDPAAWRAKTNSKGHWRLDRLPKAMYLLLAEGGGGRSAPRTTHVVSNNSSAPDLVLGGKESWGGRVVDPQGAPVANAQVFLMAIPDGGEKRTNPMRQAGGILLEAVREVLPELLRDATAVTDSRGRFSVRGWSGARLRVESDMLGMGEFRLPTLEEGKETPKLVLQLLPPGTVTGHVLTGEEEDEPIPFAFLFSDRKGDVPAEEQDRSWLKEEEILLEGDISWRAMANSTAFVDSDDGSFIIPDLPSGSWTIRAQADGYTVSETNAIVQPGGTTEVTMVLQPGASIQGMARDATTGEPLAGITVSTGKGEDESRLMSFLRGLGTSAVPVETDDEGYFLLEGVEEGADRVHGFGVGWADSGATFPPIQLAEHRQGIMLEMLRGGTLTGTVLDRNNVPIPGRMVIALSPQAKDLHQSASDDQGIYLLENILPGSYFLLATDLENQALATLDFASLFGSSRITIATVREGETTQHDVIDPSAGGVALSGELLDQGLPVAGATIALFPLEGGPLNFGFSTTRTDDDGQFQLASIAPGEYSARINATGWNGALEFEVLDMPEDHVVLHIPDGQVRGTAVIQGSMTPAKNMRVSLSRLDGPSGGILGMLGGAGGGGPGSGTSTTTNDQGDFVLDGCPEGRFRVVIRPSRSGESMASNWESKPFRLDENGLHEFGIVEIPAAGSIQVELRSDGEVPWIQISATNENGEKETSWASNRNDDSDKGFAGTLSGLTPGNWTVSAEGNGWTSAASQSIEVEAGKTSSVVLELREGCQLTAIVFDRNGQPASGAKVTVLDDRGKKVRTRGGGSDGIPSVFANMFGGGNGKVSLGTFLPGSYRLRVQWKGETRENNLQLSTGEDRVEEIYF